MTTTVEMQAAARRFVAYRLVSRAYFHLSVLFIILLEAGHRVAAVSVALAAYGCSVAMLSSIAPRAVRALGAGRALATGEVLKAAGLLVIALDPSSLVAVLIGQLATGAGFAVAASADPAVLASITTAEEAGRLQASTQSLMFVSLLVSGVIGGLLYEIDPCLPLVGAATGAVVASILATTIAGRSAATPPAAPAAQAAPAPPLARAEVRWVSYYVLTRGFMLGAFVGVLPYLLFVRTGAGIVALTLCLASFSGAAFISARWFARVLRRIGTRFFGLATAATMLLAFGVCAATAELAAVLPALVLLGAASGCVRPATMTALTEHAGSERRHVAPALITRMERLFGVCNALVVLAGGLLIEAASVETAMVALSAAYVGAHVAVAVALSRLGRDEQERDFAVPAVAP